MIPSLSANALLGKVEAPATERSWGDPLDSTASRVIKNPLRPAVFSPVGRRMTALVASILAASTVATAAAAPRVLRVTGTVERAIHARGPCRGGVRVTDEEMQE